MNLISSLVLGLALLTVSAVVFVTFVHKYDFSRPPIGQSLEDTRSLEKIHLHDISNLTGSIVSLQYNKSSMPFGIVSGKWKLAQTHVNDSNSSSTPDIDFTSSITLTDVDGVSRQKYQLTEFKNLNITLKDNSATINGTVTLIPKQAKANAEIRSVPLSMKVMNLETIILNLDKELAKHYFGDTPIFGTVSN
jgi:hypothetical protein